MSEASQSNQRTSSLGSTLGARSTLGRFNQFHPRVKWFLLFNLVITPLIVFTVMQLVASHSPSITKSLIFTSGAKTITADKLVQSVASTGRSVFWLDRLSGDTYSHSSINDGVDVVTYVPQSANPAYLNTPDLVITTYRSLEIFNAQLRPLQGTKDNTVELFRQIEVAYNPAAPDHATVFFKNRPEIAVINYPANQAVSTLINDAQSLAPIK